MTNNQSATTDVIIVGGGIAGLTAAAFLARAGRTVTVFEQAHQPGGRAQTQIKDGFHFNLGPHALYRAGAGRQILRELGVEFNGSVPNVRGYAIRAGRKYRLPVDVQSLLTTRLLGLPAKFKLARFLAGFPGLDPQPLQHLTIQDWLQREVSRPEAREMIEVLLRLSTYANAPDDHSAGAAVEQMQRSFTKSVYYIDGGWQTVVNGLRRAAESAGARIVSGTKVAGVKWDAATGVHGVRLAGGTFLEAPAVVVATGPTVARQLVDHSAGTVLSEWAANAKPVMVACLDIALRYLPDPQATFALGIDQPLYFSVHSAAAQLTPPDGALIHIAKYLPVNDSTEPQATEAELEALLDLMQPGWRNALVDRRFLPGMTVTHAIITAEQGGTAGRPGPKVPGIPNLYVAGDWVGAEGMLADASFASAKQAAELIINTPPVTLQVSPVIHKDAVVLTPA